MILAAGRGERMRPLSDATPKPLLMAGGKALIEWQIEALVRAGFTDIVINVAQRADAFDAALGDGSRWHSRIRWSREPEPLETAGGVATACPMLPAGPVLIVSADIWTRFDYRSLIPQIDRMAADATAPRVHLVIGQTEVLLRKRLPLADAFFLDLGEQFDVHLSLAAGPHPRGAHTRRFASLAAG